MASVYEAFSFGDRTVTGKAIGDITIDFCKTMSGGNVSQSGITLTELGVGKYVIMNPNITERTVISGYVTADSTKSFTVLMDPVDGNIAQETSVTGLNDISVADIEASTLIAMKSDVTGLNNISVADIEASTLIAMKSDVTGLNNISVADIEGSLVIAMKSDVTAVSDELSNATYGLDALHTDIAAISIGAGITLDEIEASTVLAKEATSQSILTEAQSLPTLADMENSVAVTVQRKATPPRT